MEGILAGAFALLLGGVSLWTGFAQLKNRAALDRWPTTKGRVIERGTYQPYIPTAGPPAFRHSLLVKYVYEIAGREFVSNRIRPERIQQPQHNTKTWARKTANKFPDEVTVHYNPEDPGESFLVQTPKILLYTLLGGGCFAILFGIVLFVTK
jgi:hypothetical protein